MRFGFLWTVSAAFFFAFVFSGLPVFAQPGIAEFGQAAGEMHRWYFSFSDLMLVMAAIAGMFGGLRVYSNWQTGARHIDAQVMGWFFSCLFLLLIDGFLRALFGVH